MALDTAQIGESLRNDADSKVPPAISGARVTDVAVTIVGDIEVSRPECSGEAVADHRYALRGHG